LIDNFHSDFHKFGWLVGWLVISHSTVIMIPFFQLGARVFFEKYKNIFLKKYLTRFVAFCKSLNISDLRAPGCRDCVSPCGLAIYKSYPKKTRYFLHSLQ
jgi:hypothetical protein